MDRQEASFRDIREALCTPPVLAYPDHSKPFPVILDAAKTGLGYILVNVNDDGSETALFYVAVALRALSEIIARPNSS